MERGKKFGQPLRRLMEWILIAGRKGQRRRQRRLIMVIDNPLYIVARLVGSVSSSSIVHPEITLLWFL